eukprot:1987376-Pleurochrysis_carterae.AAC.1
MHTSFVAPRLAPLHNRTISTPTVCSLCDTHVTAPTKHPTSAIIAHLSSDTKRHRYAHICIGVVAAIRAFRDASFRAAMRSTNYAKSALRAIHAAAAASAPTVDSL